MSRSPRNGRSGGRFGQGRTARTRSRRFCVRIDRSEIGDRRQHFTRQQLDVVEVVYVEQLQVDPAGADGCVLPQPGYPLVRRAEQSVLTGILRIAAGRTDAALDLRGVPPARDDLSSRVDERL